MSTGHPITQSGSNLNLEGGGGGGGGGEEGEVIGKLLVNESVQRMEE